MASGRPGHLDLRTRILKWKHAYVRQRREGQGDRAITLGAGRVDVDARPGLDLKHQREPIPRCDILSIRTPLTSAADRTPAKGLPADHEFGLPGRRSEEHTSELQSLRHLVCRLLL